MGQDKLSGGVSVLFYASSLPNTCNFVSAVTVFENEGDPSNTCKSVFQFLLRNSCIKGRKIKQLGAFYVDEIRSYNNSFKFFKIHI